MQLELSYLFEIARLSQPAQVALSYLSQTIGLTIKDTSLQALTTKAESLTWTRDPFDRLIVAQASLNNNLLVTKDNLILANYPQAEW